MSHYLFGFADQADSLKIFGVDTLEGLRTGQWLSLGSGKEGLSAVMAPLENPQYVFIYGHSMSHRTYPNYLAPGDRLFAETGIPLVQGVANFLVIEQADFALLSQIAEYAWVAYFDLYIRLLDSQRTIHIHHDGDVLKIV